MEIQIDPHTLERAEERGTNEAEIKDVIIQARQFLQSTSALEKPRSTISSKTGIINTTNTKELRYFMAGSGFGKLIL